MTNGRSQSDFLPFRSARLVFDRFTSADACSLAKYRSDPETARYQGWDAPFPLSSAVELIESQLDLAGPTPGLWKQIALHEGGDLVGDVAVGMSADGTVADIGYTLRPVSRSRGLATEAVSATVLRLFALTDVVEVRASLDARNRASARVVERAGFRFEARHPAAVLEKGEWTDEDRYSISRESPDGSRAGAPQRSPEE